MDQIQIRAVIFKDSDFWCAQCLEHDVAVQASSVDALVDELGDTLVSYVELALNEGRVPLSDIPKAPSRYFEMFERAHELHQTSNPKISQVDAAPKIVPEIRVLEAA